MTSRNFVWHCVSKIKNRQSADATSNNSRKIFERENTSSVYAYSLYGEDITPWIKRTRWRCSLQRRHSWGYALSSLRLRHSKPSWQTNDFDDAWAGCNENAGYALSFLNFRAVGDFVTRCWPTKPKASQVSQKLDFGRSLGSALFLEVTASIREWSAGLIPEQRPVMYLPEKRLAPLVLRKPLLVGLCVGVLVLFIVFSIFCITSFGGCFRSKHQETTLARLQCTRVFLSP